MANLLPRKPKAGDRTLQSMYDAICNIIDYLPSLEVRGDNRTIKVNTFGTGKTIEAIKYNSNVAGGSSGVAVTPDSPVPAIVKSGTDLTGYTVDIYANGYDQAKTSTAIAFLLQGNAQLQTIPPETKIIVFPYNGMLETLG